MDWGPFDTRGMVSMVFVITMFGLGEVAHGSGAVGLWTTVAVNMNPAMFGLHTVHCTCAQVLGDIGADSVITDTWMTADGASGLCAGFAYQPFCILGARGGGCDPRSNPLLDVLQAALLSDPLVERVIEKFGSLTGVTHEVGGLDLVYVWPCRRIRTWWIFADLNPGTPPVAQWLALPSQLSLPQAVRWQGTALIDQLLQWLWQALEDSTATMSWVSYAQRYTDFDCTPSNVRPIRVQGWKDGDLFSLFGLRSTSLKERGRWFAKVLLEILRHLDRSVAAELVRPPSMMIAMHVGCLALPWPIHRLRACDQLMMRWTPFLFRRPDAAMDRLPLPRRDQSGAFH